MTRARRALAGRVDPRRHLVEARRELLVRCHHLVVPLTDLACGPAPARFVLEARAMSRRASRRALTAAIAVLVLVGVGSALARYLLPPALHLRLSTPLYGSYAPEQLPVLAAHPVAEAIHRLGGALYLIIGVAQFSARLRARRPSLHRLAGYAFLLLTLAAAASGVGMVIAFPYEAGERAPSVLFAIVMVACATRALVEIRRRDIAAHRRWIARSFAVGLGVATIRLYAVLVLNTTSLTTRQIIAPTFWAGWVTTLLVAELMLQRRPRLSQAR